jgi:tetratricopeptide (TPR) repeat protein
MLDGRCVNTIVLTRPKRVEIGTASRLVSSKPVAVRHTYRATLREKKAARRYSPFDTRAYTIFAGIANCHIFARRFSEAIHWAERAVEISPNFAVALRSLTIALAHDGQTEAARRAGQKLLSVLPNLSISSTLKRPFGLPWMMDLWVEGLRKAGIPE